MEYFFILLRKQTPGFFASKNFARSTGFQADVRFIVLSFLSLSSWAMTHEDKAKIVREIQERKNKDYNELVNNYCAGHFEPQQLFKDILIDEYVPLFLYLLEKKILNPNYRWKNTRDYDEARLLHACVCNKKYEQTELFLGHGADPNASANPGTLNCFGHSYYPVFYAIGEQDCKMVELLGKYNADFNLYSSNRRPLAYAVCLYGQDLEIEKQAKSRNNPEDIAWAQSRKKISFNIIRLLTQKWANPFAPSQEDGKKRALH